MNYPIDSQPLPVGIAAHGHGFIRHRRVPAIVIALAWRFGLQRFVIAEVGEAPHHPDCTDDVAVTESL